MEQNLDESHQSSLRYSTVFLRWILFRRPCPSVLVRNQMFAGVLVIEIIVKFSFWSSSIVPSAAQLLVETWGYNFSNFYPRFTSWQPMSNFCSVLYREDSPLVRRQISWVKCTGTYRWGCFLRLCIRMQNIFDALTHTFGVVRRGS